MKKMSHVLSAMHLFLNQDQALADAMRKGSVRLEVLSLPKIELI